jgi:hypothetical protein
MKQVISAILVKVEVQNAIEILFVSYVKIYEKSEKFPSNSSNQPQHP